MKAAFKNYFAQLNSLAQTASTQENFAVSQTIRHDILTSYRAEELSNVEKQTLIDAVNIIAAGIRDDLFRAEGIKQIL